MKLNKCVIRIKESEDHVILSCADGSQYKVGCFGKQCLFIKYSETSVDWIPWFSKSSVLTENNPFFFSLWTDLFPSFLLLIAD